MSFTEMYRCGECGTVWDEDLDAKTCCAPDPTEVYQCDTCKEVHDEPQGAELCCTDLVSERCPNCMRLWPGRTINAVAIQVAGHCRMCRPGYSITEQWQIQDRYWDLRGEHVNLIA